MKQFDFYEFAGLLVPGTVFLVACAVAFPDMYGMGSSLGLGHVAVGTVLAYGAGHVVQAIGNLLEAAWWRRKGWPSDWVGQGRADLLAKAQLDALPRQINRQLALEGVTVGDSTQWPAITRQVYAVVAAAGRAGRVDTFNGTYGLCRGLAASLAIAWLLVLLTQGFPAWRALLALGAAFVLVAWRANRFAVYYARELFVQFLQLK